MDGSRVLPFDKFKAELLYPERTENISTKDLATKMDVETAGCLLTELRDPRRQHLTTYIAGKSNSVGDTPLKKNTNLALA